jgi:DeoR/GlpR family transcriptional regulator of sugar metabolism
MALMSICPIEEIHRVITGKETDPEAINEIRKINIEVDLV